MTRTVHLDRIHVAAPCPVPWEAMDGDEHTRFCARCRMKVYDLSAMTRDEAGRLIGESGGPVRATCYRRDDGTITTRQCPVGLRAARRRLARVIGNIAAAIAVATLVVVVARHATPESRRSRSLEQVPGFGTVHRWLETEPPPVVPPPRVPSRTGRWVPPLADPGPFTAAEVDAMSKQQVRTAMAEVAVARKHAKGRDEELYERLSEDFALLLERLKRRD